MADILATIDDILKSKVGPSPETLGGRTLSDEERAEALREGKRQTDIFANKALANIFNTLSLKKFQDSVPTFAEMDESTEDTLIEKITKQAQSFPRLGLNVMGFLFSDAGRVYETRAKKLEDGMTPEQIIAEEDIGDSLSAAVGPFEALAPFAVPKFLKNIAAKYGPAGLTAVKSKLDIAQKKQEEKLDIEDVLTLYSDVPVLNRAFGGSTDPGQFTDSMISGMEEDVNIKDILNDPAYMSTDELESLFEQSKLKPTEDSDLPAEVQVAGLFGKAPLWGIAAVDKAKMLLQQFTKNEKRNMDNVASKIGTEADVNTTIDDIVDVDVTAEGTAVGTPKQKKTIIDSPEDAESVFYSGLEARLMDPNTPESFTSVDAFFDFINRKGVGKAEIEDNALMDYVAVAKKNGLPLSTEDMLTIIRKAPLRKIDNVTYGDARYGGTNAVKYAGYQESGALPNTYREDVMYLPSKEIPLDPDALPPGGASHDFAERYVIGWSRLTDRKATLPVEKTAQGIAEQVDPAMIRTLKRNQKTLDRQLKGLETSAMRKLEREGLIDVDDIDNLTMAEIRNILDTDTMARLRSIDEPLEQQILQFRMKLEEDALKLKNMEATTKGQEVIVTFADEIQSDVLQNAKRFEEKLRKALGNLLDGTPAERRSGISRATYQDELRDVNPEVAEFYVENKTVFRPLFKSDVEMQQFITEFQENKKVFEELAAAGTRPDKQLVMKAKEATEKEKKMLMELQTAISEGAMKQLYPNVPFKNRSEWGEALVKRDLAKAAKLLYQDKIDDAAEWYAVSPAKFVKNRYSQSGGTATPLDQRTKNMKGIGTEEFYGGPDSVDPKGKHYTSVLEKALKRAAKENNSEFKIIKVDGVGDVFAVKITPEMLLPHKTHRKKGGLVYTPEIIDIFEAA